MSYLVPKDCALDSTYQFCTSFQRAWSRLCDLQADGSGYCCKRRCRSAFVAVDVGQGFVKAEQSGWLFLSGWLCLVRSGDARRPRPTRHRVGCRRRRSYMTFSYICIHPEEMRLPNTQRWWCLGSDRQWGASTNYVSGKRSCSWSRPPVQQVHTRMHTTHTASGRASKALECSHGYASQHDQAITAQCSSCKAKCVKSRDAFPLKFDLLYPANYCRPLVPLSSPGLSCLLRSYRSKLCVCSTAFHFIHIFTAKLSSCRHRNSL